MMSLNTGVRFIVGAAIAAAVVLIAGVGAAAQVGMASPFDIKYAWFEKKADYPTGSGPFSIARDDFNNDGIQDLVVTNRDSDNLSIYLGNGDGTFRAKTDFPTGSKSFSVVAADFNLDGKKDLATINFCCYTVSVLLGRGDGTFDKLPNFPVNPEPRSMVVGDFNRDGKPDLAIAFLQGSALWVLLGRGDGTFGQPLEYKTGTSPHAIIAFDANRDGALDLATINTGTETVSLLMGYGDGTFAARTEIAAGPGSTALKQADFNGDGFLDLAVANLMTDAVTVLISRGDGSFEPGKTYGVGSRPLALTTADFNGDGAVDIAVADREASAVTILLGRGDGTFVRSPWSDFSAGGLPYDLISDDFNRDGRPDLAVANFGANSITVLLNVDVPLAGLSIAKTGSPNPAETGTGITYVIKVRNEGPSAALNVAVLDELSQSTTFVSCLAGATGLCRALGSRIEVRYGSIPAGVTETIQITARVNINVADKALIVNSASVMSTSPETNLADNQITISTLASNPPPTIVGLYDLMAGSGQPGDRSGVVINYTMPLVLDNTAGATIECLPGPGSRFPVGATTVNCKAVDAGGATAEGKFTVLIWDCFLQDDRTGDSLLFDSFTGNYLFISPRDRITRTGVFRVTRNRTGLVAKSPYVVATLDTRLRRGSASVRISTDGPLYLINDSNYQDNLTPVFVAP